MTTAVALSAFDIVDVADLDVVRRAAVECDRVEARVLGDDTVLRLTGRPPIVPEHERLAIVRSLRDVAQAELFSDSDSDDVRTKPVKVFGRFDQYQASLPVDRWLQPQNSGVSAVGAPIFDTIPTFAGLSGAGPSGADLTVGYVPGAWDLFHIGHLNVLRRAREHCDVLIAGVVTDEALARAKGKVPHVSLANRISVVSALQIVDHVVVDYSSSKLGVWERVQFDVLFKGDDWQGTPQGDRLEAEMASVGAAVHYFPYTVHTSSTALRRILAAR